MRSHTRAARHGAVVAMTLALLGLGAAPALTVSAQAVPDVPAAPAATAPSTDVDSSTAQPAPTATAPTVPAPTDDGAGPAPATNPLRAVAATSPDEPAEAAAPADQTAPDYVPGHSRISQVEIHPTTSTPQTNTELSYALTTSIVIPDTSTYAGFTRTIVHHEITLRTDSDHSNGAKVLSLANLGWMRNRTTTTWTQDGKQYMTVSGTVEVLNANPGISTVDFQVTPNRFPGTAHGDSVEITTRSWLEEDGPGTATTASLTQTLSGEESLDGRFNLYNWQEGDRTGLKISGYYDRASGAFYRTKAEAVAAGDTDAVYGRFYVIVSLMTKWPTWVDDYRQIPPGSERLDPMTAQRWTLDYTLRNKQGQPLTADEDKPVLVDVKLLNDTAPTGLLGHDMTLGGYLDVTKEALMSYGASTPTVVFASTRTGDARANSGLAATDTGSSLEVSVRTGRERDVFHSIGTTSLFFVPIDKGDEDRTLTFNLSGMSLTGISGKTTSTEARTNDNSVTFTVQAPTDVAVNGSFSQNLRTYDNWIRGVGYHVETFADAKVSPSYRTNHTVTAVNQLVKFGTETFDANPALTRAAHASVFTGRTATRTVLYATKADGSPWGSTEEMFSTRAADLRFYDSAAAAQAAGTIVGVLFEYRDGLLNSSTLTSVASNLAVDAGTKVIALDTQWWADDNVNTVTYKGLNGQPAASRPLPSPTAAIDSNAPGLYVVTEWDEQGKVITSDRHGTAFGASYLIVPYTIETREGHVMSSPDAQFAVDESTDKRWLAISSPVTIRRDGRAPSSEPAKELHVSLRSTDPRTPYLSPRLPWFIAKDGAPVQWVGQSKTFTSTDPSFRRIDDLRTLTLTEGTWRIYHAHYIGNEEDLAKEAPSGFAAYNLLIGVNERGLLANNPHQGSGGGYNYMQVASYTGFTVIHAAQAGITKTVPSAVAGSDGDIPYTISASSNALPMSDFALLDVLPFDGDDRGSRVTRPYRVTGDTVTMTTSAKDKSVDSTFTLYYTTDVAVRTAGPDGAVPSAKDLSTQDPTQSFPAVTWHKAQADTAGTSFTLAAGEPGTQVTALLLAGSFARDERVSLRLGLHSDEPRYADSYVNQASYTATAMRRTGVDEIRSAKAATATVTKSVSGTAWEDRNHDGRRQSGEPTLAGVVMRLYDGEGTELPADAYGQPYTVTTDSAGRYAFAHLPESGNGYRVGYELTAAQAQSYVPSAFKAAGTEDTADSDFHGLTGPDARRTDALALRTYTQMVADGVATDTATADLGLVPVRDVSVSKSWTSWQGQPEPAATVADWSATVQLQARAAGSSDGAPSDVASALLTLDATNGWSGTFTGQYVYDAHGNALEYSVVETGLDEQGQRTLTKNGAPSRYKPVYGGDADSGLTVTNHEVSFPALPMTPATRSITVTKAWQGIDPAHAPAVTVRLYADGTEATDSRGRSTLTLSADNGWKATFSGLPTLTTADGSLTAHSRPITYTVAEDGAEGGKISLHGLTYDVEVDQETFTVTNTLVNPLLTVSGTVVWDDAEDQDGLRPDTTTLGVLADGTQVTSLAVTCSGSCLGHGSGHGSAASGPEGAGLAGRAAVTSRPASAPAASRLLTAGALAGTSLAGPAPAAHAWPFTIEVPTYNRLGQEIEYTVTQPDTPAGYAATVTGDVRTGFTVTNTHRPQLRDVTVTKSWDDAADADGTRPSAVTVTLVRDGRPARDAHGVIMTARLSEATGWTHTFAGLPRYDGGTEVAYSIEETDVPAGYTAELTGSATEGFTLINRHTPLAPGQQQPAPAALARTGADLGTGLLAGVLLLTGAAVLRRRLAG